MAEQLLEQLISIVEGDGASRRRLQDVLTSLLAGEVVRMPDDPAKRVGSLWTSFERFRSIIENYVAISGFRVIVDESYHFAFLVHDEPRLQERLDKHTSRTAVACRLIYHQQQQSVHLTAGVRITVRDILNCLDTSGGVVTRTPRIKTAESLRTLARYDMVEFPGVFTGADDDIVVLTPVLPRRLPLTLIDGYLERTSQRRRRDADEAEGADSPADTNDDSPDSPAITNGKYAPIEEHLGSEVRATWSATHKQNGNH